MRFCSHNLVPVLLILSSLLASAYSFTVLPASSVRNPLSSISVSAESSSVSSEKKAESGDPSEIIARRIIVTGPSVQGGYYRTCVSNEAGKFRRLTGTMSPPNDSDEAEIYVEGKRKMVEGFIRWCKKGDVGLNQFSKVKEVIEEEAVGLYDSFYAKTH